MWLHGQWLAPARALRLTVLSFVLGARSTAAWLHKRKHAPYTWSEAGRPSGVRAPLLLGSVCAPTGAQQVRSTGRAESTPRGKTHEEFNHGLHLH